MSGVHRRRSTARRSDNGASLSGCGGRSAASRGCGRFRRSSGDCEETGNGDFNGSVGDGKQDPIEQWVNDGVVWKKGGIRDGLKVDSHIFNWWATSGPAPLRQMAYDLLSVPATSCAVERLFSSAGHLLRDPRSNKMLHTTIEQREMLKNWWSSNLI